MTLANRKLYYLKNGTGAARYGIGWLTSDINIGKRPLLPYDENIDGPRQVHLRPSNGTGITTWGLNENAKEVTPENEATINNHPTSTPISGNHSTSVSGGYNEATIQNTNKIIHHGYHSAHDVGTYIVFLYKIPLKAFNIGVDYEAHLKANIRYYWPGNGSCTVEAPPNARKKTSPYFGSSAGYQLTNLYNCRTFFCVLANKNAILNLPTGESQFIFARYSVWWPFDPALTTFSSGIDVFYACDKLTQINSCAGVLGPLNENTGNFDYVQKFYTQDPVNWGRIFKIDCTIPIGGDMKEDMIVLIGATTGGWGSAGGSGDYGLYGGGNYDFYCQVQDINVNYSAGWSPASETLANKVLAEYYVSSPDVGKILSRIRYKKANSNTVYGLFTDKDQGGGSRRVKVTNKNIANG